MAFKSGCIYLLGNGRITWDSGELCVVFYCIWNILSEKKNADVLFLCDFLVDIIPILILFSFTSHLFSWKYTQFVMSWLLLLRVGGRRGGFIPPINTHAGVVSILQIIKLVCFKFLSRITSRFDKFLVFLLNLCSL